MKSILELENDKLISGGWWHTQFFDLKNFKTETDIEDTFTVYPNCMIRIGNKLICSDRKIYFIDIRAQQLISSIQIEKDGDEAGIYCLFPINENLFICGGNLRSIDIYNINNLEKVHSRPVKDKFIFCIKSYDTEIFFAGSESLFFYYIPEFNIDNEENREIEEEKKI